MDYRNFKHQPLDKYRKEANGLHREHRNKIQSAFVPSPKNGAQRTKANGIIQENQFDDSSI